MSKSQNLANLKKKLLKSRNLFDFGTTKTGSRFLTPNTKTTFNH